MPFCVSPFRSQQIECKNEQSGDGRAAVNHTLSVSKIFLSAIESFLNDLFMDS
jgi:hypothetical protein